MQSHLVFARGLDDRKDFDGGRVSRAKHNLPPGADLGDLTQRSQRLAVGPDHLDPLGRVLKVLDVVVRVAATGLTAGGVVARRYLGLRRVCREGGRSGGGAGVEGLRTEVPSTGPSCGPCSGDPLVVLAGRCGSGAIGAGDYAYISIVAAYVGLDPKKDISCLPLQVADRSEHDPLFVPLPAALKNPDIAEGFDVSRTLYLGPSAT